MKRWQAAKALLNDEITMHPSYVSLQKEHGSIVFQKLLYRFIQGYVGLMGLNSMIVLAYFGSKAIHDGEIVFATWFFIGVLIVLFIMLKMVFKLDSSAESLKQEAISIQSQLVYNRILDTERHKQKKQARF